MFVGPTVLATDYPQVKLYSKRRGVWAVEKLIAPIYVRQGRRYNSYAYRNCLEGYIGSC